MVGSDAKLYDWPSIFLHYILNTVEHSSHSIESIKHQTHLFICISQLVKLLWLEVNYKNLFSEGHFGVVDDCEVV